MSDVNTKPAAPAAPTSGSDRFEIAGSDEVGPGSGRQDIDFTIIELLFFAYRDFVGDPDALLRRYDFGRAHHRVLHFVNRNPGIHVTELLDILQITKQSLGRVLKQLIDSGFIVQKPGLSDRRQRLLFATEKGRSLSLQLAEPQSRRIHAALRSLQPSARQDIVDFLSLMVNPEDRERVADLIGRNNPSR